MIYKVNIVYILGKYMIFK